MYDIKWIREHPDEFDRGLKRRGLKPLSQDLLSRDELKRARTRVLEGYLARRRVASEAIHKAMAAKDAAAVEKLKVEVAECKTSIATIEAEQKDTDEYLKKALTEIPNLPFDEPEVPTGSDASFNRVEHEFGVARDYGFKPRQHFELGEALGMMDFELAAKLSGARFVVLQKGLARMERALGQLFLDVHTSEKHGYTEINPPLLVRDDVMFGTAQFPKFEDDQFAAITTYLTEQAKATLSEAQTEVRERGNASLDQYESDADKFEAVNDAINRSNIDANKKNVLIEFLERFFAKTIQLELTKFKREEANKRIDEILDQALWLIPTAEVPLTNLVRESIVDESSLPRRYTACTPCFRAEAGAAGKDTRGMIRQHQFTKVELVSITKPEDSKQEHERMLACAEEVLKKLDLHYRVVTLCTGDMGFPSQKTYDIEVWLPGQNMYREISSCSNCGDFQARRMNARYRGKDGKPAFVHTLNGSGVAVGRALIAVMETYQDDRGAIVVPEALKPYMGGVTKIEK